MLLEKKNGWVNMNGGFWAVWSTLLFLCFVLGVLVGAFISEVGGLI